MFTIQPPKIGFLPLAHLLLLILTPLFLNIQLISGQEDDKPATGEPAGDMPAADQPDPGVLNYHILEELPHGTQIGNVATDAKLSERYDMSQRRQLRFSFLEQPGVDTKLFSIQEVSGIITTATRIDRDKLCPQKPNCEVFMDVAVGPAQFFQVLHTRIEIMDVNDNRPRFPQSIIELEIPESALTGTGYALPLAVDRDSDMNGVQKYELYGGSRIFDLAQDITAGEVTDLKLVLIGELDRERTDFYQLRLVAYDGGTTARSGSAMINVTVLDANDNDPVFLNSTYEVIVPENKPVNSTLVTVKAKDADLGRNARLTYSLNTRSAASYGDVFGINRRSGEIYLKSPLDYEKNKVYNLIVMVRDGGAGSPHLDQCTVVIRVYDVNDNAPQVTVNTLTESAEAEISELSGVGTFVAHISAIDRDSGRNGELSCTLDSQLFRLAQLNRNQYKIITADLLDREKRAGYTLALRCNDMGQPAQLTTKLIKVRVVDENDHMPTFDQDSYAITIEENNPIDKFLLKLNATDQDIGQNARIEYMLGNEVKNLFSLNPTTGILKTKASFDHERIQKLDVRVVAADHGTPPLSATATVLVRIKDINDEKPQFSQDKYSFGIFENRPTNSEVGYVAATDADFAPFDRITYAFDARDASAGVFSIDSRTGLISTRQSLDREKQSAYTLWVLAYNPGHAQSTSTAAVTIHVADDNDNAPILDHPERGNATVSVSSRVPVGYVVYRVRAHDQDIGKNAKLRYGIVGGNKGRLFDVDPATGAVTTTKDMSDIERRGVVIRVQVRDGGEPAKTSSGFLHIIINSSIAYSRPSNQHADPPRPANNMIIVIVLSSASGIVLLILIIVLICIKLQTVQRRRHTYKCRPEAQRMLRSIDGKDEESPMSKIYLPPASAANVKCKAIGRRAQAEGSSTQNVHGCVAMEEGLQRMASEHYMTNMRYSRPPSRGGPPECPYTVHHNSKIAGMTSPRRVPPGEVNSAQDGSASDMTFSPDRRPSKRPYPFQMCPTTDSAGPKEAEMHQLLEVLRPADTESACSGDGSNPDSGRGASEHGHQELDKAESDSHSEGHQRSSVSSTESAQPFPPPPTLTNPQPPPVQHLQRPPPGSGQSPAGGQYPVAVSRGPDIRPHVYTELKTFSPGIHVRQPNNSAGANAGAGAGRVGEPGKSTMPAGGTACTASLPRLRHGPGGGTHTTTTFGTAPNGTQTITTFGTPRPHCPDGMESSMSSTNHQKPSGPSENGSISESPEPCSQSNQMTLDCGRPLTMRAAPPGVRVPEPPRPPSGVQETNLDLPDPAPLPTQQQQPPQQDNNIQQHNKNTTAPVTDNGTTPVKNTSGEVADTKVDVLRDVTDGDTSQDSGVVDAQELCQTIDDAFFKGMVIKQKTLV